MGIEYFVGTDGSTINIENVHGLLEAVDILHTQTMDNLNEDEKILRILEDAMQRLQNECGAEYR